MIRRTSFFFRQNYWRSLALTGVGLEILAGAFWQSNPRWAGIFAGVGGSILATVIVTWAGPAGEVVYQSFLRLGVTRFWSDRSSVPKDQWVKWLKSAQMRCILLGQAHGEWCLDNGFEPALVDRLTIGVNVEIFFLHPNGAGAALRHQEDSLGLRNTKTRIRNSIKAVWDISERLPPKARARLTIYVYDSTPSLGLTWIDDWMLVTHYLAGMVNLTSPALLVESRPGSKSLYAVYEENINSIRTKFSTAITQDNIDKYTSE
jgi:hypothetical protein